MSARRPLDDVRVVDLSRALAGPYASMMLADAGADVVKVEPPGGDDSRGWLPFVDRNGHRESAYYMSANRNKRSVVLDLKSDDGADLLRWLASRADVLVENYRPGVLERLGLGLDDLRAMNPRIRTIPEVYDWAQVRDTMVWTLPHPTLGDLDVPASPLQLSDSGDPRTDAPPALGPDQADVFADYAAAGEGR